MEVFYMFCSKCGAVIEEGTVFCADCGTKVGAPEAVAVDANGKAPSSGAPKGLGIASMVCGIVALAGQFFGGFIEFFLPLPITMMVFPAALAGIITGAISNSLAKDRKQKKNGMTKAGLITSIVALIVWVVDIVVEIILSILLVIGVIALYVLYIIFMIGMMGSSMGMDY
jgi:hypothetical protein